MENQETLYPVFNVIEKRLNDTYNILGVIKKNKEQIKFINETYFDFKTWQLHEDYFEEIKNLKKQNKQLLKQLFKIYENEK
jgi:hypothetical protein